MDTESRKRIQQNYVELVNNIDTVRTNLCDHLYECGIIDEEDLEIVINFTNLTTKDRVRKLLTILQKKNQGNVFSYFCESLRKSDYGYLADALENCDVTSVDLVDGHGQQHKSTLVDKITEQTQILLAIRDEYRDKISQLEEENKKLKVERGKTFDSVKRIGIVDESFVDFFVFANTNKLSHGDGNTTANRLPFGDINQLASTWELLTACRLSVDAVRYVTAIGSNKKQRAPPEPFSDAAVSMRDNIDYILSDNSNTAVFESVLQKLDFSEITGFGSFTAIADELFFDQQWNWGRVIAWYSFWAYIARGFPEQTSREVFDMYGSYIWFFLDKRYSKEISDAGGWGKFLRYIERKRNLPPSSSGTVILTTIGFFVLSLIQILWKT